MSTSTPASPVTAGPATVAGYQPRTTWAAQVGAGWQPIVDDAISELNELDAQIAVWDVKQKFGRLVFIASAGDTEPWIRAAVRAISSTAEQRAADTCEECGMPGRLRSGAMTTVGCSVCYVQAGGKLTGLERQLYAVYGDRAAEYARVAHRDAATELRRAVGTVERHDTSSAGDPDGAWWATGREAWMNRIRTSATILDADDALDDDQRDKIADLERVEAPQPDTDT